jgi:hypothetical protein
MVLKDAHVDMWPAPCGCVVIAAHHGLRVTEVVGRGFIATGLPLWKGIPARDLDTAFRRFGRRLSFVGSFDTPPPLEEFLDHRVPILQVAPAVVWVANMEDSHWIALRHDRIALDGLWEPVEDAPAGKWWCWAVWWVKER